MSLAEGVAARVTYKAYASAAISSTSEPVPATDPAATGGQILRRVSSTLSLGKDTYQSAEIRSDRQIADFRHGVKRVSGSVSGELSPGTYKDLIEAAMRGTWAAPIAKSNTELTSAAADNATSKFTFGGGDPVTEGFRTGMILRFTNLSEATNNSKNFLITGFGGASNREVSVYPAPTTMSADTAFNVTSTGKSLSIPTSSHVSRKFFFEHYFADLDIARYFTECRIGGFSLNLPPTGMATIDIPVLGRNAAIVMGGSAPFFTAPTAATTTGVLAAVNGLLRVGGSTVAVITGLQMGLNLNPSADPVVGSNLLPEIFLARANITGTMTAFFEDSTLLGYFDNETEVDLLAFMTTSSANAADAMSFYLPRIKVGGGDLPLQGEGGQSISMPFQALLDPGTTAGKVNTTLFINDTQVT